jgi:hypothetical protein
MPLPRIDFVDQPSGFNMSVYHDAQAVVLADKPLISEETETLEPALLDELICNIGTLASIFHKPPSTFRSVLCRHVLLWLCY